MTDGNRSVLMISRMSRDMIGDVTCRAENVAGSVTCTATLSLLPEQEIVEVRESPRFVRTPEHAKVMDGQPVLFTAQVSLLFFFFSCNLLQDFFGQWVSFGITQTDDVKVSDNNEINAADDDD